MRIRQQEDVFVIEPETDTENGQLQAAAISGRAMSLKSQASFEATQSQLSAQTPSTARQAE